MRRLARAFALVGFLMLVPTLAHAQAILAGVVRDSSDAVLPGVTVEAASPTLIEKVRSAVTDGSGQYRITELPPGSYTITVTLTGFATVKREGIEVTGSGVIPINVQLRVGNVSETITVSGETPVVDTQSARHQSVLSTDIINTLPATRTYGALLSSIPGLQVQGNGSSAITPFMAMFTANGGRANEGRMMIDGLPVAASFNGGGVSTFIYDTPNAEEMQVLVSGALGEAENGGPQVNLVPKAGGNTFKASAFYQDAGSWSTGNNLNPTLIADGLTLPAGVISSWDASGSGGGPLKHDKLWFFANVRKYSTIAPVPGAFANLYAGDATKWTYAQNPNVNTRSADSRNIYSIRLTGQVTPRNRVSFSHEYQFRCSGSTLSPSGTGCRTPDSNWVGVGTLTSSPETFPGYHHFPYNVTQATWSSPVTSKLLLEAGFSRFQYLWAGFGQAPPDGLTGLIPVQEQSAIYNHQPNFIYRGLYDPLGFAYADNDANPNNWRATASYVTGAHNMKFGYQGSFQRSAQGRVANQTQLEYRFSNQLPNAVSYYLAPRWEQNDRTQTNSLFAQDQWTRGRLTLQGGIRYDRAWSWAPAQGNGTSLTSKYNLQAISFPETVSVKGYNDITPRMGAAYDVFGNGKTAIKVNVGKYLQAATNDENYWANNPAGRVVTSVMNRSWVDGNHNYVVDCDLLNPAKQVTAGGDTCGQVGGAALNFGSINPALTVVNPAILQGWGVRPYDWQFGAGVQQELLPRVSLEVSYNRRWFGNFFVTDNTQVNPSDYNTWTLTVPQNSNLPGAGNTLTFYDLSPAAFARGSKTYQTFETDYAPARTQYWHGVNTSLNARLREGLTLQAGTSTGRGVQDTCALDAALPQLLAVAVGPTVYNQQLQSCHVAEPWMTVVRGLAAYTIPKIDVLVSTSVRSQPNTNIGMGSTSATSGPARAANYNVPNTVVAQALGRLPSSAGGVATGNTAVNLLLPATVYGPRITQVDMRFAKVLRFAGRRADLGVDLYNLFNTSTPVTFIEAYDYATSGATYLQPSAIVPPRFVRINLRFEF
jgi:hypothetical protein